MSHLDLDALAAVFQNCTGDSVEFSQGGLPGQKSLFGASAAPRAPSPGRPKTPVAPQPSLLESIAAEETKKPGPLPGQGEFAFHEQSAEFSPVQHAVAQRFNIPPAAVKSVLETHPDELARRDRYVAPSSQMHSTVGPTLDYEDHPLGTARIGWPRHSTGNTNEAYVDFLREFDPSKLNSSEHEQSADYERDHMKKSGSVTAYVNWLKAGHKPPPISVYDVDGKPGAMQSSNRRRLLAAQMSGAKSITGWHGTSNPETGNPLSYGDILRAAKDHETQSFSRDDDFGPVEFGRSHTLPTQPFRRLIDKKRSHHDVLKEEEHVGRKKKVPTDDGESGWTKVGGSSVHVDDDGVIDKGCPGLLGEEVEDLIDESDESRERREARQHHAYAAGVTGDKLTPAQAKSLGSDEHVAAYRRDMAAAKAHPVPTVSAIDVARGFDDQTGLPIEGGNGHEIEQDHQARFARAAAHAAGQPDESFAESTPQQTPEPVQAPRGPAADLDPKLRPYQFWAQSSLSQILGNDLPRPEWLQPRAGEYQEWTDEYDVARHAGATYGVSVHDILATTPEAHLFLLEQSVQREKLKQAARKITGLHAGRIGQIENKYRDHSAVPGFDEKSRDFAAENPGMGFDPDGHDTPQKVWDFIREGAQPVPAADSREVADFAASMIAGRRGRYDHEGTVPEFESDDPVAQHDESDSEHDEWGPAEEGDASFDPSQWSRQESGNVEPSHVLSIIQGSPNQPKDRDWKEFSARWGVNEPFHQVQLPMADVLEHNHGGRLRLSNHVDQDAIQRKVKSKKINPAVISSASIDGKPTVIDGTHSLHAAHALGLTHVPAYVSASAAKRLGIPVEQEFSRSDSVESIAAALGVSVSAIQAVVQDMPGSRADGLASLSRLARDPSRRGVVRSREGHVIGYVTRNGNQLTFRDGNSRFLGTATHRHDRATFRDRRGHVGGSVGQFSRSLDGIGPVEFSADPPSQVHHTQTPAFKKWHEGSHVVHEDGTPKVVYHGTGEDTSIDSTDLPREGVGEFHVPAWFGNQETANKHTTGYDVDGDSGTRNRAQMYPVHLSLKNPHYAQKWEDTHKIDDNDTHITNRFHPRHDGVIWRGDDTHPPVYVAFHPHQIKSAIGNSGAFDPADNRITFSRDFGPVEFGRSPLPGQKELPFDAVKSKRPQIETGHDGTRQVDIPETRTNAPFRATLKTGKTDGLTHFVTLDHAGKDWSKFRAPTQHVERFLDELHGHLGHPANSGHKTLDHVLSGGGKYIGKGNDNAVYDAGNGTVVKAAVITPYHEGNGLRSPDAANAIIDDSVKATKHLRSKGVLGILPQYGVNHDGRSFSVMPKVDTTAPLTETHIQQLQGTLSGMHGAGYRLGDQVQAGLDHNGNAAIYDVGSVSKLDPERDRANRYDREDDDFLELQRLAEKHGITYHRPSTRDKAEKYSELLYKMHDSPQIDPLEARRAFTKLRNLKHAAAEIDPEGHDAFGLHDGIAAKLKGWSEQPSTVQMSRQPATGQGSFDWDEESHPRDDAGRFADKLHHQIKNYLTNGGQFGLPDIHNHTGHTDHDALDPLANPTTRALKSLVDADAISRTGPEHHNVRFYLTDEQREQHEAVGFASEKSDAKSDAKPEEKAQAGPAGLTKREAIAKASANKSGDKGLSHDEMVHATYLYTGTAPQGWSAVAVKGMREVEGDKGEGVTVPEFEMPSGYKPVPVVWDGGPQSACCGLCGHDIKNIYYIQNDAEKWTMGVGSECVTKFGEGDSGERLVKKAAWAANRDFLSNVWNTFDTLGHRFGDTDKHGQHHTHLGSSAPFWKIMAQSGVKNHNEIAPAQRREFESAAAKINTVYGQLKKLLYNSAGAPVTHAGKKIMSRSYINANRGYQENAIHYDASKDAAITAWTKRNAEEARKLIGEVDEILRSLPEPKKAEKPQAFSRGYAPAPQPPATYTQTPEFKAWHEGSHVAHPDGSPMVVHHGSPDVRGILKDGFRASPNRGGVHFASSDYATADSYADDRRAMDYQNAEPHTIPLHLAIKNPMVIDAGGKHWRETEKHVQAAKDAGHDGLIIHNSIDHYQSMRGQKDKKQKPSTVYAWFHPHQAKSAITAPMLSRVDRKPLAGATANSGAFSPGDNRLTFSRDDDFGPVELFGDSEEFGPVEFSGWNPDDHPRGQPENAGQFAKSHAAVIAAEQHLADGKRLGVSRIELAQRSRTVREAHGSHFSLHSAMHANPRHGSVSLDTNPLSSDYSSGGQVMAAWSKIMGGGTSPLDAGRLVGAKENSTTTISVNKRGTEVTVKTSSSEMSATYQFFRDNSGRLACHMESFFVNPTRKSSGVGLKVFSRVASEMAAAGCAYIDCHAARKNTDPTGKEMDGYSFWPAVGFDMLLDDKDGILEGDESVFSAAKQAFPHAASMLDIFDTKGGPEWWKTNGTDLLKARFLLQDGSRSWKDLTSRVRNRIARRRSELISTSSFREDYRPFLKGATTARNTWPHSATEMSRDDYFGPVEFARKPAKGQVAFDFESPVESHLADAPGENVGTKQDKLFDVQESDVPPEHHEEAKALSEKHGGGEVRRLKNGDWQLRAPIGGKVSEVNGVFYIGGRFMPIHGIDSQAAKKLKPKREKSKGDLFTPPKPNENGRQREQRQEMTPDEIAAEKERREEQRQWNEIARGPLGRLLDLGDKPRYGQRATPILDEWMSFAEKIGKDGVEKLHKSLEADAHEQIDALWKSMMDDQAGLSLDEIARKTGMSIPRRFTEADAEWDKNALRERADRWISDRPRLYKAHEKLVPGSHRVRELLSALMEDEYKQDKEGLIPRLKKYSDMLAALVPAPLVDVAEARQHGYLGNKFDGRTAEGKKVKAGDGWVKKNADGKYETFTDEQVRDAIKPSEFSRSFDSIGPVEFSVEPPSQVHPTQTPGFKKWHEGSHVVNRDGSPMRVYHGTQTPFETADTSDRGYSDQVANQLGDNIGMFFTNSRHTANDFSQRGAKNGVRLDTHAINANQYPEGAAVLPTYLSVKNPRKFRDQNEWREFLHGHGRAGTNAREQLESLGHDGVVIHKPSYSGKDTKEKWFVAFHPHQVKSSFNREFDPADNRITFSRDLADFAPVEFGLMDWFRKKPTPQTPPSPAPMEDAPEQAHESQWSPEVPVESSNVHSYSWEKQGAEGQGNMIVRYKNKQGGSGPVYRYIGTPKSVYEGMEAAPSKGGFVWDRLRVRGSKSGHQYPFSLAGTGATDYIPRAASLRRGFKGEHYIERSFEGRKSSLAPGTTTGRPAERMDGYDPAKLTFKPSPPNPSLPKPVTPQPPAPSKTSSLISKVASFFRRPKTPREFSRDEIEAFELMLADAAARD